MTITLVALWGEPNDVERFDRDYETTHLPLVTALPGLTRASASTVLDGRYHRVAEMAFEDADALRVAMRSDAGRELAADTERLRETYGSTLDLLTVEEQSLI